MALFSLSGTRVLDLSANVAGAYASKLFAMTGADVVVVEPPAGSPLRQAPPLITASALITGPDAGSRPESAAFAYLHAYKQGIVLDVGSATGRPALERLVAGRTW